VTELDDVRLETLVDALGDTASIGLPGDIEAAFGGPFRLADRLVYANFVTSIDGVAALAGVERSSATISGGASADRFVMALLRAVADAVVVGVGTLREHRGPWTAEGAFPAGADRFRRARAAIAGTEAPTLAVVTASGELPPEHPAVPDAVVATTASGARTLSDRGVRPADVVITGETGDVDVVAAIEALRGRGCARILTEGGPRLMGSMLAASAVDELFLTLSPKVLGGGEGRPPLSDGAGLPGDGTGARLVGVRRSGDHLFLRYDLRVAGRG
jgi:riboflavin biosynthesis pyrimidine reductase